MRRFALIAATLLACACARAQTDLPGPVSALPNDAHTTATGVCSWNAAQTKKACMVSDNAATGNPVLTVTDTFWNFDHSVKVNGNVMPQVNLGDALGGGSLEWLELHVQNIFNDGANPFSISSTTGLIAIDAVAAQPIQFYTTNTLRGQFLSGGALEIANLAGSGTRCVRVSNVGDLSAASSDCGIPPFADNVPLVKGSSDPTKLLEFNVGLFTTGTTQIISIPNGSFTIAGQNWGNIFTGSEEFQSTVYIEAGIYNYTGSSLSLYSDIANVVLDTGSSGAGVLLYTNNIQRFGVDGSGNTYFSVLVGTGTRCVQVSATGFISPASGACGTGGSVTSIATTSPISGGTITTTGTISCPTCAVTNADNNFSTTQTMRAIVPAADNAYPLGDTTHNYTGIQTANVYDYVSGTALGIYANSSVSGIGMAISTGTAADIAFYPNLGNSLTLKSGGTIRLNNLAGGGNRCLQVDNNGDITAHTAGTC